jgi:hypothetical protein
MKRAFRQRETEQRSGIDLFGGSYQGCSYQSHQSEKIRLRASECHNRELMPGVGAIMCRRPRFVQGGARATDAGSGRQLGREVGAPVRDVPAAGNAALEGFEDGAIPALPEIAIPPRGSQVDTSAIAQHRLPAYHIASKHETCQDRCSAVVELAVTHSFRSPGRGDGDLDLPRPR